MSDEYLWDRTGRDAEVERLERLLRPFALRPAAKASPRPRRALRFALSAAAAVLFAAAVFLARTETVTSPRERTFEFAGVGHVRVDAHSKVKVLRDSKELILLRLERGGLHAKINPAARPRLFQVETPATTCIDLGCEYRLDVDEMGRARVRVMTGRVAFADGTREVYVPAGATCTAARGKGSATPLWDDSPAPLISAVRAYDEAPPRSRAEAAREVFRRCAQPRDTLPLWHLLQDPDRAVRETGLEGLLKQSPLPEGVTMDACLRGDPRAVEAWKEHLISNWFWY